MNHRGRATQPRRWFLRTAGASALSLTEAVTAVGASPETSQRGGARRNATRLALGLPTYMFKHYDLDQTIAMAKRLAVDKLCLRSNLLPMDSSPVDIRAAIEKVRRAGLKP